MSRVFGNDVSVGRPAIALNTQIERSEEMPSLESEIQTNDWLDEPLYRTFENPVEFDLI